MNKEGLKLNIINMFPEFEIHWEHEDLRKEDNGDYTAHGLMGSFTDFYRDHYLEFEPNQLKGFCDFIEDIVQSDSNDKSDVANAICTCFLENIAGDEEAQKIDPLLGKICKEYYLKWV